jgi:hypothetical protein
MNTPVSILLKGGYSDVDFINQSGYASIGGSLRIKAGTLKVNKLTIMPCDGSGICPTPPAVCGDGYVATSEQCDANLVSSRNPHPMGVVMWTGYAGSGWVWLIKPLTAILSFELLPQLRA